MSALTAGSAAFDAPRFLEASPEDVMACCYIDPGTSALAAIEEGRIVVIRAEDDDQTMLAEAHPKR